MGSAIRNSRRENHIPDVYSLVWFDSVRNRSQRHAHLQKLLQASIDHTIIFNKINQCENYIRSLPYDDRIILIVSGRLIQDLVSRIHELRQVSSIYIYCNDKSIHTTWPKTYRKIKDIVTQHRELIDKIRLDRSKRSQNEVNEQISISIFQTNAYYEQWENISNEQFIYVQLLIDVLFQLRSIQNDKAKLVHLCKQKYYNVSNELKILQEFELDYSSESTLYWFMRDSCIYRILSKAFRTQDIDTLFLFRFFIHDIQNAIIQSQCLFRIRVYRSQLMVMSEVNQLRNSIGRLISINSFFSTTISRELAIALLNQSISSNNLERVLFEIDADSSLNSIKPFGFVHSNSNSQPSEEVLFTLGSIFRLVSIHRQSDGLWLVQLTLCRHDDEKLQKIFQSFRSNRNDEKFEILAFGRFAKNTGKLNEAEKFFTRLLYELSNNPQIIADCYYELGCIEMNKNIHDTSLNYHIRSLGIKTEILRSSGLSIAESFNKIGDVYTRMLDYKNAHVSYYEAWRSTVQSVGEDHLAVAICCTNLGGICQKQEQYTEALSYYEKALKIRQTHLQVSQPDLAISHNNVAIVYSCLGKFDLALEHYNVALRILQQLQYPLHPELAVTYCGLGFIYERKGYLEEAVSYYDKATLINRQILFPTHPHVLEIEQHIQNIQSRSKHHLISSHSV